MENRLESLESLVNILTANLEDLEAGPSSGRSSGTTTPKEEVGLQRKNTMVSNKDDTMNKRGSKRNFTVATKSANKAQSQELGAIEESDEDDHQALKQALDVTSPKSGAANRRGVSNN